MSIELVLLAIHFLIFLSMFLVFKRHNERFVRACFQEKIVAQILLQKMSEAAGLRCPLK